MSEKLTYFKYAPNDSVSGFRPRLYGPIELTLVCFWVWPVSPTCVFVIIAGFFYKGFLKKKNFN